MARTLHVIANPAAGRSEPVIHTLRQSLRDSDISWSISVTQGKGDAYQQAAAALDDGVDLVAAYGGDGTIAEVGHALLDTKHPSPLVILPGGTGNALAKSLSIPLDLGEAASLLRAETLYTTAVDVGQAGDIPFFVGIALGPLAEAMNDTDRDAKDSLGLLAYLRAGAGALLSLRPVPYFLTVDGKEAEVDAIGCYVANTGNFSLQGLTLDQHVSAADGLLDVFTVPDVNLPSLAAVIDSLTNFAIPGPDLQHWQGKTITIDAAEPQAIMIDGEKHGTTPLEISMTEHSLRVVTPPTTGISSL